MAVLCHCRVPSQPNRERTPGVVQMFRLSYPVSLGTAPPEDKTRFLLVNGHPTPKVLSRSAYSRHLVIGESKSNMSNRYCIPDNLTSWKWPRHCNPYYPEVKAASAAWARSFGAFSPKAQYAYDRCDFSTCFRVLLQNSPTDLWLDLLASLAYPLLDKGKYPSVLRERRYSPSTLSTPADWLRPHEHVFRLRRVFGCRARGRGPSHGQHYHGCPAQPTHTPPQRGMDRWRSYQTVRHSIDARTCVDIRTDLGFGSLR